MAFVGYLEAVDPFQVRGWAYDPEAPSRELTVEILLHGRVVGVAHANIYRKDLEHAGIGAGNHAFIYNIDQKLAASDLSQVAARVPGTDASLRPCTACPLRKQVKFRLQFHCVLMVFCPTTTSILSSCWARPAPGPAQWLKDYSSWIVSEAIRKAICLTCWRICRSP